MVNHFLKLALCNKDPQLLVAHSELQWFVVMLHRNQILAVAKPVAALKSFEQGTHINEHFQNALLGKGPLAD